jgi:hypothetical protein
VKSETPAEDLLQSQTETCSHGLNLIQKIVSFSGLMPQFQKKKLGGVMKIVNGALVREQNLNDVDDSAFDTGELGHAQNCLAMWGVQPYQLDPLQFIDVDGDGVIDPEEDLERHVHTKFRDDISSDQAHMFALWTGMCLIGLKDKNAWWPRTTNGDRVSIGFWAYIHGFYWLLNISLLIQIILFWIPIRWCDGNNPTVAFGPIKLNLGYKHHCGDYRLFKQCLYYAPIWIKRLVSKKTLKKMTRLYWTPEPNAAWVIEMDDRYVDTCL